MNVSFGVPLAMIVSAIGFELSIGSKRANAMCAATKNTVMVSATLTVAASAFSSAAAASPPAAQSAE